MIPWSMGVNMLNFLLTKSNPWLSPHLFPHLMELLCKLRFKFQPAYSPPLELTTLGPGIMKQCPTRCALSLLPWQFNILNMVKRPQEMQVYIQRDVFAPPNTDYVNQAFQPEPGRGDVIILRKSLWLAAISYWEPDLVGSLEPCRAHAFLPLTKGCSTLYLSSRALVKLFHLPCINATLFRPTGSLHSDPPAICII